MKRNKELFENIYQSKIKRSGADELLRWIECSDFFTAPASAKHHLNQESGLCEHSLNVYRRLRQFLQSEYEGAECQYSEETIAVVALLHDLCKTYHFKAGWKNQKTYDPDKVSSANSREIKHDAAGDFIWETVPIYEIDEKFIYGHGEKSVFLIMQHMRLTEVEAQAIRFHMGAFNHDEARNYGDACAVNPLVFFLHMADGAATFLDESKV